MENTDDFNEETLFCLLMQTNKITRHVAIDTLLILKPIKLSQAVTLIFGRCLFRISAWTLNCPD
jgi:hypothetical protein